MSHQERLFRQAQRRLFIQSLLKVGGRLVTLFAGLSILALLANKLWFETAWPWWWHACWLGAGFLTSVLVVWFTRPSRSTVLTLLDDRLELKDSLGTSHFLRDQTPETMSAQQQVLRDHIVAQAEARAEAARKDLPKRFAFGMDRFWGSLPVAVMVFALLAWLMPQGIWLKDNAALGANTDPAATEEINHLQAVAHEIQIPDPSQPPDALDPDKLLEQVEALAKQPVKSPDAEAAKQALMDDKAQALEQMAKQLEEQNNQIDNRLSRLQTNMPDGPANALEQALRNGDMEQAEQALNDLMQKLENNEFSEAEKQALQQQLGQMAQQLQQMQQGSANNPNNPGQNNQQNQNNQPNSQNQNQNPGQPPSPNNNPSNNQALQQLAQGLKQLGQQAGSPQQQSPNSQAQHQRALQQAQQQAMQGIQKIKNSKGKQNKLKQAQNMMQGGQSGKKGKGKKSGQLQSGNGANPANGAGQSGSMGGSSGGGQGQNTNGHGTGSGGDALNTQDNRLDPNNYNSQGVLHEQDASNGKQTILQGAVGPMTANEATRQFNAIRRAQQDNIERAVEEDRLPARYNQMRQRYFNPTGEAATGNGG